MLTVEEREHKYREHEQHCLEAEINDLRSQLGKSAAVVGEYRELQQELDRSERQRDQLSDHIQVYKSRKPSNSLHQYCYL